MGAMQRSQFWASILKKKKKKGFANVETLILEIHMHSFMSRLKLLFCLSQLSRGNAFFGRVFSPALQDNFPQRKIFSEEVLHTPHVHNTTNHIN